MATDLFQLVGKIAVDNGEANEKISETTENASSASEKFKAVASSIAKVGVAVGTAALAAGTAVVKMASDSAASTDTIDKMSQKIGVSREAYQELDFVCSQSGMSVDSLQTGMKTLTAAIDGAASGTKSNVEQFEALGIAVTDANGNMRSQEEILFETMEALQGMENQTEKARLASELFGRSGSEMMPLLNGAAGSIDEMRQKAHDLGLVMSDDMIDSGVELNDTLDQMKRSLSAVVTKVGSGFMPIVQKACEFIISRMPMIQSMLDKISPILSSLFESLLPPLFDMADQLLPIIFDLIEQLIPPISEIVQSLLPVFTQIISQLSPILSELISAVLPVLTTLIKAIVPIIEMLLPYIVRIVESILPVLVGILSAISPIIEKILPLVFEIIDAVLPIFVELFETLMPIILQIVENILPLVYEFLDMILPILKPILTLLQPLFELVMEFLSPLLELVQLLLPPLIEFIGNGLRNAFTVLKPVIETITTVFGKLLSAAKDIFEKLKDVVKKPINAIIGFINGLVSGITTGINKVIGALNKIHIDVPEWVTNLTGLTSLGFNIPTLTATQIPLLAEGGEVNKQGRAIVGEAGAELIDLPRGARVTPLTRGDGESTLDEIKQKLDDLIDAIKGLANPQFGVYMDGDVLVGQIAPAMDVALGNITIGRNRGR